MILQNQVNQALNRICERLLGITAPVQLTVRRGEYGTPQ